LEKALHIKPSLVQYLINEENNIILGNEVRFGSHNYFADLVSITDNQITAYEIKSQKDDLRNYLEQLKNYSRVFDYVYLVVTENHFRKAIKDLPDPFGLILISNQGQISIIRKAKISSSISKIELLYSMTIKHLKESVQIKSNIIQNNLRASLTKKTIFEIKELYLLFLKNKLISRNIQFYKEIGEGVHIEDVSILSIKSKGKVL